MKIFDTIEVKPSEIFDFILVPLRSLFKIKAVTKTQLDDIIWEYQIPRFKLHKNIRKEDISRVRPLCRKCKCELRNDFSYPIDKTTFRTFFFTCPNCMLVHKITAETLRDYFSDLVRRVAYGQERKNEN